jgi:hypothetical protein
MVMTRTDTWGNTEQRSPTGALTRRPVVAVQAPSGPPGQGQVCDLVPGSRATFGSCGCDRCAFDIVVSAVRDRHVAGAVSAHDDHWRLHNLSSVEVLVCADLEDPSQTVRLPPGRVDVTMPFELSLVSFAGQPRTRALTVFGPEPTLDADRACTASAPRADLQLRPGTAYYSVLEVLCGPRLHGDLESRLPTSNEIVGQLRKRGVLLSRRAVDHHIDYLVDRLALRPTEPHASVAGHGTSRRESLTREVIRLGLLGPRRTPA